MQSVKIPSVEAGELNNDYEYATLSREYKLKK